MPALIGQTWHQEGRSQERIGAEGEEGGALSRRFCCEGRLSSSSQSGQGMEASGGRRSRALAWGAAAAGGVGYGERRRGDVWWALHRTQPGGARPRCGGEGSGRGEVGTRPRKLRGVGGSAEAKGPALGRVGRDRRGGLRVRPGRPEAELEVCGRMGDE